MYEIKSTSDGATLGMTDAPYYIKLETNGCFTHCSEPAKAQGICFNGVTYNLLGCDPMKGVTETVVLNEVDAGNKIAELQAASSQQVRIMAQTNAATKLYVQTNVATIPDAAALKIPDFFKTWSEVLEAGKELSVDDIINKEGKLYRVAQPVTPAEHQPPDGEGMVTIYRPIEPDHAGTQEDPIPWRYGMDTEKDKYYSYNGKVYLCNLTMSACTWAPDTEGLWQWTEVNA